MPDKEEIWVVGNESTIADKAFGWDEGIPNITDADVVVLDLSTLHTIRSGQSSTLSNQGHSLRAAKTRQRIDKMHATVTKNLEDKILGGGHVVYLLHHDNILGSGAGLTEIFPFGIEIEKVAKREKIDHANHRFKEYLKEVRSVNYVLKIPRQLLDDESSWIKLKRRNNSLIVDRAKKRVGAAYDVILDETPRGQLTFLPSLSSDANKEMIDVVISELRGDASPPPPWVNDLKITGMDKIKDGIAKLELKKVKIEKEIAELESEKRRCLSHGRLLHATGKPLEKAVKAAFSMLGFTEIAQMREKDKEDWKIDFKSVPDVSIGVIEVKGVGKRTGRDDISQCDMWVSDYRLMNPSIKAKGIFVPNQHRMSEFPASRDDRKHFEPNELEFAKTRNICIIPTYVLFEAVNKILSEQSPDRDKIEQLIFNTNGVLESLP